MKLLTFIINNVEEVGVMSPDMTTVHPIKELGCSFSSMLDLIENISERELQSLKNSIQKCTLSGISVADVEFAAPIPHPRHDILCIGQNYTEHAVESARFKGSEYKKPEYPVYFSKRVNKAVPHEGFITCHIDITEKLDYEAELAVIIGKKCSHVAPEDVYKYIFGYTIVNDISARDVQINHKQFTFGKGLDDAAPMGPYIVTINEFDVPPVLSIKSRVNGELRQNSSTGEFIFDIPFMISQLSAGITLYPGDIFITGTPSGVGMGFNPPKWLKSGDVVECEIENIGVMRNAVK